VPSAVSELRLWMSMFTKPNKTTLNGLRSIVIIKHKMSLSTKPGSQ